MASRASAEPESSNPSPPADAVELLDFGRMGSRRAIQVSGEDLAAVGRGASLARGLGRAYGDAALPAEAGARVLGTRRADRVLAFDAVRGVVRAEAGLSLAVLNRIARARGFSPPVSPGTEQVTLGGMVAADVHGKNHHHAGTFGAHLRALRVLLPDGRSVECSPDENPELFDACCGGMGLVGHVLEVEVALERIPSPWIRQHVERTSDLATLLERLRALSGRHAFTVGWLDGFGRPDGRQRGVLTAGDWAEPGEAPAAPPGRARSVPFPLELPTFCSSPIVGRLGNFAVGVAPRRRERLAHPTHFFYPLDRVDGWNRLYGRRGFIQYQCVLPHGALPGESVAASLELFRRLRARRAPVFLCVVKDFGAEGRGLLSFPKPGFTFALDIPFRGERTQRLVDDLNEHVIACGGRVYLAKDQLTRREHFRAMEPRLDRFLEIKRKWDPAGAIESALSRRLFGTLQ